MRKYFCIFKINLVENARCISSSLFELLFFALIVFVLASMWNHVFVGPESIKGYNYDQILWYTILAESFWFGMNVQHYTSEVHYDIHSGNIMMKINKPYNYVFFTITKYISDIFLKVLIFLLVGIVTGIIFVGPISLFSISDIIFLIPVYALAVIIHSTGIVAVNLFSFWVAEIRPIVWSYMKIMIMLGLIFPFEMLPKLLQPFAKCMPVYACIYSPMKLTLNFSQGLFLQTIILQISWIIGLTVLALYIYNLGIKKINANGEV